MGLALLMDGVPPGPWLVAESAHNMAFLIVFAATADLVAPSDSFPGWTVRFSFPRAGAWALPTALDGSN